MWRLYFEQKLAKDFNFKRIMAIGDIHGHINILRGLIESVVKFNPAEDALIFLGDYIDRAPSDEAEAELLSYLCALANNNPGRVVLLRGNHEELFRRTVRDKNDLDAVISSVRNGGASKTGWPDDMRLDLCEFCEQLPLYYESDNHIFVHGGVHRNFDLARQSKNTLLFSRENLWGYEAKDGSVKKVIAGHTPVKEVEVSENFVRIDLGGYRTGRLAAYDVLSGRSYIYDKKDTEIR